MTEEEINDLKKLSPEERIKKVKELKEKEEEKLKKANELLEETEGEIEEQNQIKQQTPIDQLKAQDIGGLMSDEEKEIFKTKRFIGDDQKKEGDDVSEEETEKPRETFLEDKVDEFKPTATPKEIEKQHEYQIKLSQEPANALYNMAKDIYSDVQQTGQMNDTQRDQIYNINKAMDQKMNDIKDGSYKPEDPQYVTQQASASKKFADDILDVYKG